MGMGNDGAEVSNSLDTCSHLNNLGIREMNLEKSIGDMQRGNAMGNVMGMTNIDSITSETQGNCQESSADHEVINNTESSPDIQVDTHHSDTKSDTKSLPNDTDGVKIAEIGSSSNRVDMNDKTIPLKNENGSLPNTGQTGTFPEIGGDRVISQVGDAIPVRDCPTDLPQVPVCRNESLLRVSYLKRNWGGKRVSDVRSVSELLETINSLEKPVIMPLPRSRGYYDQWARIPRGDVYQRLYPRSNSVSTKCWTLFQAIQNDQASKAPAASLTPETSPQKLLAPPPPSSEVTCKSLDSIIDHYNQLMQYQAMSTSPRTSPPAALLTQRQSPQNRNNSGSSRSSSYNSGNNNSNNSTNNNSIVSTSNSNNNNINNNNRASSTSNNAQKPDSGGPRSQISKSRMSPATSKQTHRVTDSRLPGGSSQSHDGGKKSSLPDQNDVLNRSTSASPGLVAQSSIDEDNHAPGVGNPQQETVIAVTSPSSHDLFQAGQPRNHQNGHESFCRMEVMEGRCKTDQLLSKSSRDFQDIRETLVASEPESHSLERPWPDQSSRDNTRSLLGINTKSLCLSLPHERAQPVVENYSFSRPQPLPTNSNKNKLTLIREDTDLRKLKTNVQEKHERFPSRNTVFVSRGKSGNTTLEYNCNKTRLKNLTRSIPSAPHNINGLRDSLLIQEINCDSDPTDQRKVEYPGKRRDSSSKRGHNSRPSCKPTVELPMRMHSMLERHLLSPTLQYTDDVSPERGTTPSGMGSAVSLASVHFLDLADLKSLLKKSNTSLNHL